MIEFEVKARVPPGAEEALRRSLGAPEAVERHADTYYAHPDPARDFARTDEALRLSQRGGRAELTYKGPRLDPTTKSRREVNLPVGDAAAAQSILWALGFRPVATVRKERARYHREGFEVALDVVPGLGTFVELERMLPEGEDRSAAERQAMALLARLGLTETVRTSYLEMLLGAESG